MFESAELGHRIDDATYEDVAKKLRPALLHAQYELLSKATFPVIVLVNGVDYAGKGETVNLLNEWLDPRHVRSTAFGLDECESRLRPPMWRFWKALPPKGGIGVLFGNWYSPVIEGCSSGTLASKEFFINRIKNFEQVITDDGALLIKLWFHLSKKGMKHRLEELESHARTRWRVTKSDWKNFKHYDNYVKTSERILRETSTNEQTRWTIIDGSNSNYRAIKAAKTILDSLRVRLDAEGTEVVPLAPAAVVRVQKIPKSVTTFSAVDSARTLRDLPFEERLSKDKYEVIVVKKQGRLARLARSKKMKNHAVVVVFEGPDAAGKGGAIRRVTPALDVRQYEVVPVSAPSEHERLYPYLWRFWKQVPAHGRFTIFDRSWYGRVLVERVEGFASAPSWRRAYDEINDFENQLSNAGIIVVKIWLAITKDEQLRRFKEREKVDFKQFKITPDDWRNREKWNDYLEAGEEMIDRTSTAVAPWTVLEANDKHLARVRVLEAICKRMEDAF